jgi:hypothetical protein
VPVAQLLRDHPEIKRDLQHQRVGVAQPPLPRGIGLLEHPPGRRRIIGLQVQPSELMRRSQDLRVVLAQPALPGIDAVLEQHDRRGEIRGPGEGLSPLPHGKKRRRLRHGAMVPATRR